MRQKPQIKSTRIVTKSRLFTIEDVDLLFSNGNEMTFQRIVSSGEAAMVVPMTESGVLMVREYAAGTDRYELGFVKGRIDPGETPQEAAQRELKEEIGFGAEELTYIREMHGLPHYSDFSMHLFFASGLYPSELVGDEAEPLEQINYRFDELNTLLEHPEINDPRVLTGLLLLEKWLKNERIA